MFYVLIGTRRLWARPATVPLLLVGSLLLLPEGIGGGSALTNLARFVTHDIVPTPFRNGDVASLATWAAFAGVASADRLEQSLARRVEHHRAVTDRARRHGDAVAVLFPLVSRQFVGPIGQPAGRVLLVVARSTPEYMLGYVLLQLLGPSMLPAIIALAVHNGAIVGYLMGRHADALRLPHRRPEGDRSLRLRCDAAAVRAVSGIPLYRWGVIVRGEARSRYSGRGDAATMWMPPSPSCARARGCGSDPGDSWTVCD